MKMINTQTTLDVQNLRVNIEAKEILRGISLKVKSGEFHVVMGPNGSGKSTLTYALMGHPSYKISAKGRSSFGRKIPKSKIKIGKKIINDFSPDQRAKLGLMLAFQNPLSIPGVSLSHFLRIAYRQLYGEKTKSVLDLHKEIISLAKMLRLDESFLKRSINDGFSGGERKKAEMLQLLVLEPKIAIFDEIDTGLDVDALIAVANGISMLQKKGSGILLITHYQRILNYLKPTHVHVMIDGVFVREGGNELVKLIEEKGYVNIHRS